MLNLRNLSKTTTILSLLTVLLAFPALSSASLIGDTVTFECTNCGPPTNDSFVVQAGIAELSLFDAFEVDVESSTLEIGWLFDASNLIPDITFRWSDLDWNGLPGQITGASIDASSTWGLTGFLSFTGSSVTFINNSEFTVAEGDFLLINIQTRQASSVPEPSSVMLFGTALFGLLAFAGKKRSR